MNKLLIAFSITTLLVGCDKSDSQLTSSAERAVKEQVIKDYSHNMCDTAKALARFNSESDITGSCDSDFKPSAGLRFSDMKVYRHKDSTAVCGIVSGRTDISRIGAKFIYLEKNGDTFVFMQKSKYRSSAANKKTVDILASAVRAEIAQNCQ